MGLMNLGTNSCLFVCSCAFVVRRRLPLLCHLLRLRDEGVDLCFLSCRLIKNHSSKTRSDLEGDLI